MRALRASPLVVPERADDVSEREQAFVDLDALLKTRALRLGALRALGAGEVHEVHLRARRLARRARSGR